MSYSTQLPTRKAGPVDAADRFASLDTLRGVAVLGILVMNIYAFAMPFAAYGNPFLMGGDELHNLGTWVFTHIVADQKFYSIFSMLFGAGLILMMDRAEQRGSRFGRIYYRRTFWLLLLGLFHAYFIWFGDILFFYALMGMVVFLFRHTSPKRLIIASVLLMLVPILINFGSSFAMQELQRQGIELEELESSGTDLDQDQQELLDSWREQKRYFFPTEDTLQEEITAYKGSYSDSLKHRVSTVIVMQLLWLPTFVVWRVGGLMLLGMALMKLGIISGERGSGFYIRMALVGYAVGLPLAAFSAADQFAHQFDPIHLLRYGNIANYVGAVFVALGHIAAVNLVVLTGVLDGLARRFAAVGRMALSNYLLHSIVMTLVFYGYGLGLYAAVPRLSQQGLVIGLIAIQLVVSTWWLKRFRFGPVEWLWRSLTYWERQPMRQ